MAAAVIGGGRASGIQRGGSVNRGDEEWVTSAQVIERLLEFPALRQCAAGCVLRAVRRFGNWVFRRSDLEAWITAELEKVAPPPRG
jgi:hypothetical protein